MPMQPSPMAETSSPCVPSRRRSITCKLAKHAGVPERVAPRLRVDAQPVRAEADANALLQLPGTGVDRVHLAAVAAREPQHLAVGGDATHVRRTAAPDAPLADLLAGLQGDQRDRRVSAVRDVEVERVATHVEAV